MKTKIASLLLAALMLAGCLASCVIPEDNGTDTTDPNAEATTDPIVTTYPDDVDIVYVDKNGYELDNLPAGLNFGKKITTLAWEDHTMREFQSTSDTQTGDIIDDALLKRNNEVETRLGVELEFAFKKGNSDNMSTFIQAVEAGEIDKTYDIVASYSRVAPKLALTGKSADLYQLEYMYDLQKPWWAPALVKEATIADQIYFCSGDISTNLLWMMQGMFFNKLLIEQYNLDDPYELVLNNDWTFSKFVSMAEGKYQDTDGANSGKKSKDDIFGYCVYEVCIDDFQISAGINAVANTDGLLADTGKFSDDTISELITDLINFLSSNDAFYQDSTSLRNIFFEQRALFMNDRMFVIAGKDNAANQTKIDFEYGVVPVPKYKLSQPQYLSNIGHTFTIYSVPSCLGDERQQISGAVLECLASEGYRNVTPQVFEVAMKTKYSEDQEAAHMFDLIKNNLCFDMSRMFDIGNYYTASAFRKEIVSGRNNWFSNYNRNSETMRKTIKEINDYFSAKK